jgi:hypothetical protein
LIDADIGSASSAGESGDGEPEIDAGAGHAGPGCGALLGADHGEHGACAAGASHDLEGAGGVDDGDGEPVAAAAYDGRELARVAAGDRDRRRRQQRVDGGGERRRCVVGELQSHAGALGPHVLRWWW